MGSIYNKVLAQIERGKLGLNEGLPMGLPKTSGIINDVQAKRYDLIAGKTSSGKTAFTDSCYVLSPFNYLQTNEGIEKKMKFEVLYFSLEIDGESKFTKMAAQKMWTDFGKIVDVNALLSRGKNRITRDQYEMAYHLRDYFYKIEEVIHIIDTKTTVEEIHTRIFEYAKLNGKLEKRGDSFVYTPNHPNQIVLIIIDTINLLDTSPEYPSLKKAIDALSKKFIWWRNICGYTPVVIQQLNAQITDPMRLKQQRLEPEGDDLEDSKRTSKDCNTFMTIFDPSEFNAKVFRGYNIEILNSWFRSLRIIKNRDGERGQRLGLKFFGKVGLFSELPTASQMEQLHYELATKP